MWTPEFKMMCVFAVFLGLAIGTLIAYLETIEGEHTFITHVYRSDGIDLPAADISALHEEARRITRDPDDA